MEKKNNKVYILRYYDDLCSGACVDWYFDSYKDRDEVVQGILARDKVDVNSSKHNFVLLERYK